MNRKTRNFTVWVMAFLLLGIGISVVSAEEYISANDLDAVKLSASAEYFGFTIHATEAKGVTIEKIDEGRTAEDGEIFNGRIKLNGGGSLEYRSIEFTTSDKAELSVYLNSSSKTDARVLILCAADGTVIENMSAPVDSDAAGIAKAVIPVAGTYFVYSKSSGINIYQIIVE